MQLGYWSLSLSLSLSQLLCCRSSASMSAILSAYTGQSVSRHRVSSLRCAFTLHGGHCMEITSSHATPSLSYYSKKHEKSGRKSAKKSAPELNRRLFNYYPLHLPQRYNRFLHIRQSGGIELVPSQKSLTYCGFPNFWGQPISIPVAPLPPGSIFCPLTISLDSALGTEIFENYLNTALSRS